MHRTNLYQPKNIFTNFKVHDIRHILQNFDPINLDEMDSVKLMNRTDRKFCFSRDKLSDLLLSLKTHYRVLEVANTRISAYRSLYFDDEALSFYRQHHTGRSNRVKIRHRTYVDSHLGFLEVKIKNNKGRTIKTRMKQQEVPESLNGAMETFIEAETHVTAGKLLPVIWINYHRITLVNRNSTERLTIDLNLEILHDTFSKTFSDMVIVEVKQDKKAYSPFFEIAKQIKIAEGSISKYCMAIALTNPDVKKNNFKQKLKTLSPLLYHA